MSKKSLLNANNLVLLGLLFTGVITVGAATKSRGLQVKFEGAYLTALNKDTTALIAISDGYFSYTAYHVANKQFYYTWGGPLQQHDNGFTIPIEYHSLDKNAVGQLLPVMLQPIQGGLKFFDQPFKMVDAPTPSDLAGCWRIAGRMQNDQMREMQLGARRTLKLLTNNRFQWMAINIETGEFSGTGGGRYSFENGVYTEMIEFFSRDSSRVGQSLSFEGKVENGKWYHSGKSSRGEPISEVWVHLEQP